MSPTTASSSLRALMEGLIDYAGLFPPARLPLAEAVATYSEARRGAHRWMLGRFICPASQLTAFGELASAHRDDAPWPVAVLGTAVADVAAWPASVARDLAALRAFNETGLDSAQADVFEVALPVHLPAATDVAAVFQACSARLFLEVPIRAGQAAVEQALCLVGAAPAVGGSRVGAKFRTGGVTADLYPSVEAVAHAIDRVAQAAVPFKATAGLHHPIRHHDADVGVDQHGFFNVFVGAALRHCRAIQSADLLQAVLAARSPGDFGFDDDALRWGDITMSTGDVRGARAALAVSYGSCSFDEPIADLHHLHLM